MDALKAVGKTTINASRTHVKATNVFMNQFVWISMTTTLNVSDKEYVWFGAEETVSKLLMSFPLTHEHGTQWILCKIWRIKEIGHILKIKEICQH